jgi:hypothetical protein
MPQYFPSRATSIPQGIDPRFAAAQAILSRHNWMGESQPAPQGPPINPYTEDEFAPTLQGLSPTGRYNDMKLRRIAMYQNLVPRGEQIVNGQPVAMNAVQMAAQQPDIDSGIGYGTNALGQPTAVTPLGGRITTIAPVTQDQGTGEGFSPLRRTLSSRYGTGSSIDTGIPASGTFPITMASGERFQLPLSSYLSPQAQNFQNQQNSVMKVEGKPTGFTDVGGDKEFQDLLAKLKKANAK